ncbi:serine/threonine-protein kinase SIK2-like isoform X2 [Mobula hypostoma]|uniref:serine/threonine-protein kinase SIK2-like isoform X2 n=1 Tax=Mobula hypostoma TaxID=723540 RepID=UPI002FC2AD5B
MVLAGSDQSLGIEPAHGLGMLLPESDQERGSAPDRDRDPVPAPAPQRRALRVGFYDIEGTLGKGNFAVVKLARHRVTRSRVAIKIIDKRRLQPRELQRVHREVLIMKFLNHPHIIKLYQVMETRDMLYIVTEFAQNGEMFEHLSERGPLSECEARDKFGQLLSAVEYCHRHHIVHRDLKTENMLLDADMNIKLADFGFGNFYRHGEMLSTWCGSPPYAAPEVFEGKDYEGPHLDVWSLGVVLYVLVCGSFPFDGPTLPVLRQRVIEGHFRVPFFLSEDCEDLIRRMLTVDPLKRISIPEIKLHCWLTGHGVPHQPPALPIRGETVNVCSYNYQVLGVMQTLGIDRHKTVESLQNNSYNHFSAIYYLLLERIKEHRQAQAGIRPPSALCPHPQARGGHSQTTALSPAAELSVVSRDRSMSPGMECLELSDRSMSPGMERSELSDRSVSPGMEHSELRGRSVSPGMEHSELRGRSVSPGMEHSELRGRSVSPEMECSELRDQSVSPGMECLVELRDQSESPGMERLVELRDRSVSPGMECSELRDRSVTPGMERLELRDQFVSPRMERSELRDRSEPPGMERLVELRDRSVSPGMECSELRDRSVSPGMECLELRDRSVSPGMERSERRDRSVSPGMKRSERRDRSVSPGMECSELRDQSMSPGMECSVELRKLSASPIGVEVSIARERGLRLKDNGTGSVMRPQSAGSRRHTVAEGLFTPGQHSTPGQRLPRFLCQSFRARAGLRLWRSGELPWHLCPPPYRLALWDRPAQLLPEWRHSQSPGWHERPHQPHRVQWQNRELQLAFVRQQEAPPCGAGASVLQKAVGSVLLPQTVPSPLSCSLAAFHVPSLLSELLQWQQRLQADREMEDFAAPCLSKVVLVN